MLAKSARFLPAAAFSLALLAQSYAQETADRVLHFTHDESDLQLHEIATDLRGIADIQEVSVDTAQSTVALHGTAAQINLAEWLVAQWGTTAQQSQNSAAQEYKLSSDDVIRVFHVSNAPTPRSLQEIAVDVRFIAEIPRIFIYNEPSILTVRGTASEVAVAGWVLSQLDVPANQAPRNTASPEYRFSSAATDDVVQVFFTANAATPQALQEIATDVRSIADIRRLFVHNGTAAIIVRGTAAQATLAAWLIKQLDQPANQPVTAAAPREYRLNGTEDDVVHVFFLTHSGNPQRLQQIAVIVRQTTRVRYLFTYNAPQAMMLRGTAAQIALADRLINEQDR
jgi:type II secretory pathway component GspD/PulD (secretin)